MKKKIKRKKKAISITLPNEIIEIIDNNMENRSKYIEYCIIQELCKNDIFKEKLKNKKIII